MTGQLMIIRHGFSTWNAKNLFTGWVDVPLSDMGEEEARRAGRVMDDANFHPDVVFTSVLQRAIRTADIALAEISETQVETHRTWRLNERHYGALTGLDKKETVKEYGEEQVALWRRSFDVPPPPLPPDSPYDFSKDTLYSDVPCALIPQTECLKDVVVRVIPYFEETIAPRLLAEEDVLIVAHGNSLRALMMKLENISSDEIAHVELPTATPRLYRFGPNFTVEFADYVEDAAIVDERKTAVKNQTAKN